MCVTLTNRQDACSTPVPYKLVQLRNGEWALHSTSDAETMHPGHGPVAEADALYVEQLRIPQRVRQASEPFVIWDVGLGAAANALAAIRACKHLSARLHIVSFDFTDEPLRCALQNVQRLEYIQGYAGEIEQLLMQREARFASHKVDVLWEFQIGDFPKSLPHLSAKPKPYAIFFDPFSPAKNPAMWTQSVLADLFRLLDKPCSLATYSRSTMVRTAMLLGGFFVGQGRATGLKEETTIAATTLELIDEPLDESWLKRAERSRSAEPLRDATYTQAPLAAETLKALRSHPQFRRRQP